MTQEKQENKNTLKTDDFFHHFDGKKVLKHLEEIKKALVQRTKHISKSELVDEEIL